MIIGTTYSHRHAAYLRLDPQKSFQEILAFPFDVIRLGCYWDEIEPQQGKYDFTQIASLLTACEEKKQKVMLTVGMKAPRWPEFYYPSWLEQRSPEFAASYILGSIAETVRSLKSYTCISEWQVENEPLDPSGATSQAIPLRLLEQEITIVKKHDSRPVSINLWGNELTKRKLFTKVSLLADTVGIDLYYKVPYTWKIYTGPRDSDDKLRQLISEAEKPVYITELQAEPWENGKLADNRAQTPSMNSKLLMQNARRAVSLNPAGIFLWGSEYWLLKKQQGDTSLWEAAKAFVAEQR